MDTYYFTKKPERNTGKKQQWCWSKWMASQRRTQQIYIYHPVQKPNSKCNKDLNIRSELLNMITKNMGNIPEHTVTGKDFLNRMLIAHALEQTIIKLHETTKLLYGKGHSEHLSPQSEAIIARNELYLTELLAKGVT